MNSSEGFLYAKNVDTLIVECEHPNYGLSQPILVSIAELVQSFDVYHVYKIRNTSLWQAAAQGLTPRFVLDFLRDSAKSPIPFKMQQHIAEGMTRWGQLVLEQNSNETSASDSAIDTIRLVGPKNTLTELRTDKALRSLVVKVSSNFFIFALSHRAELKRRLAKMGYPVLDKLGYVSAKACDISLCENVTLRPYQDEAVSSFFKQGRDASGVIVLPCGSGKTVVGIAIMTQIQMHTLIVVPNDITAKQWQTEILKKTTAVEGQVSLYKDASSIAPITIVTYQKVTAKTRRGEFRHLNTLIQHVWGLVIYDEVHILPAPLFRLAAELQSARRLGLTATLVREDGEEREVYSLIGPKCFEKPWKTLEEDGYIAKVRCVEVRVPLAKENEAEYVLASSRAKHRIAADNINKLQVVSRLCHLHGDAGILIMGHYIDFLQKIAKDLHCPFLHGGTPREERQNILQLFRAGKINTVVLSRIANMGIDLPGASIVIQVSGLFGSRQEEAQRLGRLLRPKSATGVFYTLVSSQTIEEQLAKHRQIYLVEQGYAYDIQSAVDFDEKESHYIETTRMRRQR